MQTKHERRRSLALRTAGYATHCIEQVQQELDDARTKKAMPYVIRELEQELTKWQSEQRQALGAYRETTA